jgi:exonuclease VII small subunit
MTEAIWKKEQDTRPQPTPSWAVYAEAANKFRSSAEAFMEHVHILNDARSSYQQAMSASTELRNRLDASDQTLTSLMTKLEEVVNNHFFEPVPDRRKPELVKGDSARTRNEGTDVARSFP